MMVFYLHGSRHGVRNMHSYHVTAIFCLRFVFSFHIIINYHSKRAISKPLLHVHCLFHIFFSYETVNY